MSATTYVSVFLSPTMIVGSETSQDPHRKLSTHSYVPLNKQNIGIRLAIAFCIEQICLPVSFLFHAGKGTAVLENDCVELRVAGDTTRSICATLGLR